MAQGSEELISAVDCKERTDTAYTGGNPSQIKVITLGGKPTSKATGHAVVKMQKAAHEAGVYLAITSGFRTMAEQKYLYNCYLTGSCNNGNLAAKPGYSNHQSGIALDLTTSGWLAKNAGKYGFVRTVPSEDWHYEYTGGKDPGGPCSGASGAISWVSPKEGGWYRNGIWFKVKPSNPAVARVTYWAGAYKLGTSTDKSQDFAVRYTFTQLGERTVSAVTHDASGKELSEEAVTFRVEP